MNVLDYIAHETERQSGTVREALGMHEAWLDAVYLHAANESIIETDLLNWIGLINGQTQYRKTEVTFRNMSYPPVPADSVPRAMSRLGEQLASNSFIPDEREYADYMAREFLIIHPFTDGNGRVGSLLWNFLNGTITDPEPMPYFFGEN